MKSVLVLGAMVGLICGTAPAIHASNKPPTRVVGWSTAPLALPRGGYAVVDVRVRSTAGATARPVLLQTRTRGAAWKTTVRTRTSARGALTVQLRPPRKGTRLYRLRVPGTPKARPATTKAVRVARIR